MTDSFSSFRLGTDPLLLLRDGDVVPVTPHALACLLLLVERRHTAVSKQELMDTLWPDSVVEEGSLTQLISLLRKALAPDFPAGGPIQTIPKTGYRFAAEITVLATPAQAVTPTTPPEDAPAVPVTEAVPLPKGAREVVEPERVSASVQPASAPRVTPWGRFAWLGWAVLIAQTL